MSAMLAKWLDAPQRLPGRGQLPIRQELVLVLGRPFDRKPKGAGREVSLEDVQVSDGDLDFEFAIDSMEVGRVVILVVMRITIPKNLEISGISEPYEPAPYRPHTCRFTADPLACGIGGGPLSRQLGPTSRRSMQAQERLAATRVGP